MSGALAVLTAISAGMIGATALPAEAAQTDAALLRRTWHGYRRHFVQRDGRVIDWKGGGVSTSEGQAYALVRAVWADDQKTFNRALQWTRDNLQQGDPTALPAWQWGQRTDKSWGVLDTQPASDADQWMAWALLLASERWEQPALRRQALGILDQLWAQEVTTLNGRLVLLPGPWAATTVPLRLNPSYFLPFAWRDFAKVDPKHDWGKLIDDSYAILEESGASSTLVPDWLYLDIETGRRAAAPEPKHDLFGFEAARFAWTLAAEVKWHDEPRARAMMQPIAKLNESFEKLGYLPAISTPSGEAAAAYPHLSTTGSVLAAWAWANPEALGALRETIDQSRRCAGWGDRDDYFAQNWTWLGLALLSGEAVPPEMTR